jgi:hypothetical protein
MAMGNRALAHREESISQHNGGWSGGDALGENGLIS